MNQIVSPFENGRRALKDREIVRLPCISPNSKNNCDKKLIKKRYNEDDVLVDENKRRISIKFNGRKIKAKCSDNSSESSNSKKNSSTNHSSESNNSDSPRMLSRDEEIKWINIHSKLIEKVKLKVEYARKSRFLGLVSKNILNHKALAIHQRNIHHRRCLSIDTFDQDPDLCQNNSDNLIFKNPNINVASPTLTQMRLRKAFSPVFKIRRLRNNERDE